MKFARQGGLSPVEYKPGSARKTVWYDEDGNKQVQLSQWNTDSFHTPPARRGIYAFIHPYIELFLVGWKLAGKKPSFRIFEYEGLLWCHFTGFAGGVHKGSWVKMHTKDLAEVLRKVKHRDATSLMADDFLGAGSQPVIDPYKRGLYGFYSKDHLEVFIEAKDLGKIRGERPRQKQRVDDPEFSTDIGDLKE